MDEGIIRKNDWMEELEPIFGSLAERYQRMLGDGYDKTDDEFYPIAKKLAEDIDMILSKYGY